MKNNTNPKWILIFNTIPVIILCVLLSSNYKVIYSLLDDISIKCWIYFSSTLVGLGFINIIISIYYIYIKRKLPLAYYFYLLISNICFLYAFSTYSDKIIPSNIPGWMISENLFIYPWTLLIPSILYSFYILILEFTPKNKKFYAGSSFGYAFITPILFYLMAQLVIPLSIHLQENIDTHIIIILTISCFIIFLFFLLRGLYIMYQNGYKPWENYEILFTIIFPILGLFVNNIITIFGDFSSYWFFILAFFNGLFISLINFKKGKKRLFIYCLRCFTFPFTTYFFVVFLPYFPLSIIAIIAIGIGLLMLTPLILFPIHLKKLLSDYNYLKKFYSEKKLMILAILFFMILPAIITLQNIYDHKNLTKALGYVYYTNLEESAQINSHSLKRTLKNIYNNKTKNSSVFNSNTPYLSAYYNWMVLDHMTLSDSKSELLEKIFIGETINKKISKRTSRKDSVTITKINSLSNFDPLQRTWISKIELELTNHINATNSEFKTTFNLPDGCWISDYYLYINKHKEPGILSEKKSALWIYSQIIKEKKDPGILYYLNGNTIAMRVFPFSANEVRKTGIEFMHKEPVTFYIAENKITLGNDDFGYNDNEIVLKKGIYLSANKKKQLPLVERTPYYHFIVDNSEKSEAKKINYIERIKNFISENKIDINNSKISLIGSHLSKTFLLTDNWKEKIVNSKNSGGFYLDRALKNTLIKNYKKGGNTYPIIIIVTDSLEKAIMDNTYSDIKMTFPESPLFYKLKGNGLIDSHSLLHTPSQPIEKDAIIKLKNKVRAYPDSIRPKIYFTDNQFPEILPNTNILKTNPFLLIEKDWNSALYLQSLKVYESLHPEEVGEVRKKIIEGSFKSQFLTSHTSYIALENEAQKMALKNKQDKVLKSGYALDLQEDVEAMSEPGWIYLFLIITLFLIIKSKKIKLIF